jgi:hypothetical protein
MERFIKPIKGQKEAYVPYHLYRRSKLMHASDEFLTYLNNQPDMLTGKVLLLCAVIPMRYWG